MNVSRWLVGLLILANAPPAAASGPLGIYGIVENVSFEPDDKAPERIQVWGAFAYVDGTAGESLRISPAARGYLYFRLPSAGDVTFTPAQLEAIKNEWADLKSVAGTGEVIGFGRWGYIGGFEGLRPDVRSDYPPYILERGARNPHTDLRVRQPSEKPAAPALYQTETGIVKLSPEGSHAGVVKQLRDALARR
jgi:hypothetical protein